MADEPRTESTKPAPGQTFELVGDYPPKPTRRGFLLSMTGLGWLTFSAASAGGTVGMLRFMLPNVLFEPPQVFKAGKLDDYEWDKPDERFKTGQKAWLAKLRKDWDGKAHFFALDTTCTHLGCTPNVLFNEAKIKCPCHGSGFYYNGINFEGPTPRPLERYKVYIDPVDGQIVVDKTKKFQYEKGQWEDKDSYIEL